MNGIKLLLVGIMMASLSVACSEEGTETTVKSINAAEYYQELNISYGTDSRQVFDIFLPKNRTLATKVLILVHGGGWTSGDKIDMHGFRDGIRKDLPDVAIVNMNYRLADDAHNPYPMQIEDISAVIRHLKLNQEQYTISDDYGFIGVSAGGHLAMLWSYGFDSTNTISMVCSIVGPTNFTDPAYVNNTDTNIRALMDLYGVSATTAFLEEVSPYHRATTTAPPTILFYGGKDPLIPTSQGTAMRDRLQELGVTNAFTLYENAGHGWIGFELLDTWSKLKSFIQTHL